MRKLRLAEDEIGAHVGDAVAKLNAIPARSDAGEGDATALRQTTDDSRSARRSTADVEYIALDVDESRAVQVHKRDPIDHCCGRRCLHRRSENRQ